MCYTYIRRKRGKRKLWTTDFYGRQRRKRRRKRRTTLLEDIIIGILLFLCVRRKVKRESEREREKRKSKKQQKKQQTKKKKKERTRVIFDVKAFFSILISREESQLQSASQKHHKTRTNHHQTSHINNVCGWD